MTSVIVAGCAVVMVLLLWLVIRLQRQLGQLSLVVTELRADQQRESTLRAAVEVAAPAQSEPDSEPPTRSDVPPRESGVPAAEQVEERTEQVSVITRVPEPEDDPTTARIASVALGGPLIKVAAFSYGVRHALDEEQRMRISYAVRMELRRQRKMRRRRRAQRAPSEGWRP